MNIKKIARKMLKTKEEDLIKHQITEQNFQKRIEDFEETSKRQSLIEVRQMITELEKNVEYLKSII